VSQPCESNCNVPQPGDVDEELNEFWVGSPWKIFQENNLSAFERNRLFINAGDRRFLDISYVTSTDSDGDGRSSLAADFNNDGRLDLAVRQAGGGPLLVYENRFAKQNFLKVTLRGRESNRLGVGCRLIATAAGREIVRECSPTNSYLSQAPLVIHFGIGNATQVDRLLVKWPSGHQTKLTGLPINRHLIVTEGADQFVTAQPGVTVSP